MNFSKSDPAILPILSKPCPNTSLLFANSPFLPKSFSERLCPYAPALSPNVDSRLLNLSNLAPKFVNAGNILPIKFLVIVAINNIRAVLLSAKASTRGVNTVAINAPPLLIRSEKLAASFSKVFAGKLSAIPPNFFSACPNIALVLACNFSNSLNSAVVLFIDSA